MPGLMAQPPRTASPMSISLPSREGHMTTRRSSSASSLRPVEGSRLYEQLVEMLCEHIDDADLQPGDRLPPDCELAAQVGVGRASISRRPWPRRFWASSRSSTARARSCSGPAPEQQVLAALRARQRRLPEIVEAHEALEVKLAELVARRRGEEDLAASTTRWRTWRRGVGRRPGRGRRQALPTPRSRPRRAPACSPTSWPRSPTPSMGRASSGSPSQATRRLAARSPADRGRHQDAINKTLTRAGRCRADRRRAGCSAPFAQPADCRRRPKTDPFATRGGGRARHGQGQGVPRLVP